MNFEIRKNPEGTQNEVVATPSDREGLFVFSHEHYGTVAVRELVLRDFPGEIRRDLEIGNLSRIGNVVYGGYDNRRQYRFADVAVSAIHPIPGSGNSVSLNPRSVQEMAPVAPVTQPV